MSGVEQKLDDVAVLPNFIPVCNALIWYRSNVEDPYGSKITAKRYQCWLKEQGIVHKDPHRTFPEGVYFKDEQSMVAFLLRWS